MPLSDHEPNLDDRTFEDLLREARLRIPRYCPEWTDFNESDPGTAIVQLFAWFTELMLYRLNQVPERNYLKFLALLNLQPRPARPAHAFVVLTPTPGGNSPISIPIRSRFEVPAGGDTVYFETTAAVDLVPYLLDAVQVVDGGAPADVTPVNERGTESFRPLGWFPQPGNALYVGFKPPDPDPKTLVRPRPAFPERVGLRFFLPPAAAAARPVSRGVSPPPPEQTLVWEYRSKLDLAAGDDPDEMDRWRPLAVLEDDTRALTREGSVVLRGPGPDILATKVGLPTPDDGPRYWVRVRLARGTYRQDQIPEVAFVRPNVVDVESLATFTDEVLGEADGFRREFKLRHAPVAPDPLEVTIDGDSDALPWAHVDDFLGSSPDDKHYTLNAPTGEIRFGDGMRGRVPPPGGLVIARVYRAGGGRAGNVGTDAINAPPTGVRGLDRVTNPRPATDGADEETLDELKDRAPQAIRGDGRAVTAEDYRRLAAQVPGVAKATALERRHPDYPGFDIPGTITVVVVPDTLLPADVGKPAKPMPSQDLLDRVARDLNRVRTVGTEVFVTGPRYHEIGVRVRVAPADGASAVQVKDGVRRAVEDYLAPVPRPEPKISTGVPPAAGGTPPPKTPARRNPAGWPFGEPFFPARLYEVILSATDETGRLVLVRNVTELSLTLDGQDHVIGEAVRFDDPGEADVLPACAVVVDVESPGGEGR